MYGVSLTDRFGVIVQLILLIHVCRYTSVDVQAQYTVVTPLGDLYHTYHV